MFIYKEKRKKLYNNFIWGGGGGGELKIYVINFNSEIMIEMVDMNPFNRKLNILQDQIIFETFYRRF